MATDERQAWKDHALSQLRYFRSLSMREKMAAVQGMADVVRRLQQMRAEGAFEGSSFLQQPPPGERREVL